METKTETNPRIVNLLGLARLHTRLYLNATEGLEAHLTERPNEWTNHAAWLAGHLVSTRYLMLNVLGKEAAEPHPGIYAHGKGIDPELDYPALATHRADWNTASALLADAFDGLHPEKLAEKAPFATPMGETVEEFLAFFLHHEAYHIGQLGILRRYFGKEAMKYS